MTEGTPPGPLRACIGASSRWSEDRRGALRGGEVVRKDTLTQYVTQFDTLEVNGSSCALPRAATVLEWVEAAPPGFTYALTAPRRITHEMRLAHVEAATLAFLDVAASMGAAAGPVLFQFPRDFTRRRDGRALAEWLGWLAPRRRGLRIVIEVQADDLMTPAFVSHLAALGYTLALVDGMDAPGPFALWAEVVRAGLGPGFAYMRRIGEGCPFDDDRSTGAPDLEQQPTADDRISLRADRIRWLAAQGQDVFAYVHSPSEGRAFATARRLRAALEEENPSARVGCSKAHAAEPDRGLQLSLL